MELTERLFCRYFGTVLGSTLIGCAIGQHWGDMAAHVGSVCGLVGGLLLARASYKKHGL